MSSTSSSSYSVQTVLPAVAETIGEGPFWEPLTGTLFSVSIDDGKVHIWHAASNHHETVQIGKPGQTVSFVIPCESGGFLAGVDQQIVHYDWTNGQLQLRTLHSVDAGLPTRFNDAKCDPAGRLLAGTMSLEKEAAVVMQRDVGSLYAMDESAQLKKLDSGFSISNGMAWHGSKFFFAESLGRKIFAYDWDATSCSISNQQVAVDFNSLPSQQSIGVPDGLTIDVNGNLWVACFFGSRVLQIDPEAGSIVSEVKLPASNITSCCFGGVNMDELFVTSAKYSTKVHEELAGSIFKVTGLGVKGAASVAYKGRV